MISYINTKQEKIIETVLIFGDSLWVKFIVKTFLENIKLVNEIWNIFMYIGIYKNKIIPIIGSGMKYFSIGIYLYKLFKFYNIDNIIWIGSTGSYDAELKIYNIVNAIAVYDENNYTRIIVGIKNNVLNSLQYLFATIEEVIKVKQIKIFFGIVYSSDIFYHKNDDDWKKIKLNIR